MNLEKKDRLILINQYRILSLLDPANAEEYEERLEILRSGYEIFYSDLDRSLFEEMPKHKAQFVLDVLSIYRMVEFYRDQNPDDTDITGHSMASFRGFDSNGEDEYMGFTRSLINNQRKFQELKKYERDGFNSHFPTLDRYRRMVNKWHSLGLKSEYSKQELLDILDA